jgi:hypothetical protein
MAALDLDTLQKVKEEIIRRTSAKDGDYPF